MDVLENRFSIKRVIRSSDEEYIEALKIYNKTTPVDIKTNTNEITYWLDNCKTTSKFELFLFILYLDGKVAGFAMLSYLASRRILIHDYLQLTDSYRLNVAFFAYISLIYSYFSSKNYDINFYVTEISNKNAGKEIEKESVLFRKLLCLEKFGFVNAPYRTLPLGVDHHESSYDAWIYIKKSGDVISSITRETFLNIVRGIYFDYYETWYIPFLSSKEMDDFKKSIIQVQKEIEEKIEVATSFEIINASDECVIVSERKLERTDGTLPAKKRGFNKMLPLIVLMLIVAPIVVTLCYNWILDFLDIPISSVSSMIGSVFAAIMALVTAYLIAKKNKL